ncbi:MAG TPA: M1 family metallopeptidase [Gemmatimonadales bacterium]|nr:M1 family metallopeptidase [Gemmatimonadales bacterium]
MPPFAPLLLLHLLAHDTTGYWQQHVTYRITASLDEPTGILIGRVRIDYVNHSPATLRDFYVHQYLNAFRPGSRWAAADAAEERERFQHLVDPDYAFERITSALVMGRSLRPDYPYAPDSTIAHWALPRPLAPGDSLVVEVEWQARLSTVPRRQGRRGRRFDFAQWYPKVVVFDKHGWEDHPLYPAGEFYGEFATYDVTLDLPADQVIGATGVPVEGDPGWEHAKADPDLRVEYQRDYYAARPATCAALSVGAGRKCVHFHAEHVHHFAFSLNPQYLYDQGRAGEVVVHVLYLPDDRATWGNGLAVRNTVGALAWLDSLYGTYQWPQLTNVHRIEGGGTEFPMLIMDGSASLGLIIHESGHQYTMGQLANNEWREAWLDEGFTSFQTGWFFENRGFGRAYDSVEPAVLWLDLERWSEPISLPGEEYRDFASYNAMVYTKAQLFFEELRYVVGDPTMRRILRTYFDRWKLKHVDEDAFRDVAEELSGKDLNWLFAEWLHATPLFDYRLKRVERYGLEGGRWYTVVTIERRGDGRLPVEIGDQDTIYARASGQPAEERVGFVTMKRPGRLQLDPRGLTHDYDLLNNRERRPLVGRGAWELRLDDPTRERARRDRLVRAWLPVAWSNDNGGVTVGLRERSNYLSRYDRDVVLAAFAADAGATHRLSLYGRWSNPIEHLAPRTETSVAAWSAEGRAGVALSADRTLREHLDFGPDPHVGFDAVWMATTDLGYLDRALWDDAGTVEAGPWFATTLHRGETIVHARVGAHAGVVYSNPGIGIVSPNRYDFEGFGRFTGEASVRFPFWAGTRLGLRLFGGAYAGTSPPVRQRRIPVAGADPYETFTNPFLRSRGALFLRPDFYYHAPGNANLRGFDRDLGGRWALSLNSELVRSLSKQDQGLLREVALVGFADLGIVDTLAVSATSPGGASQMLYEGGLGLLTRHQIGDLDWTLRFDAPLVVFPFPAAADRVAGKGRFALRWQVSLSPSF